MPKLLKATRKTPVESKPSAESLFDNDEAEVKEEAPKPTPKTKAAKKSFEQTDRIMCRSITQGGLYVEGAKTKALYEFGDYGDTAEIEYRDLVGMVNSKSDYLFRPYLIVDDADFVAEFPQLDKVYSDIYGKQDLIDIFNLPVDDMISKIKSLPAGAMDNLKHLASTQVANGALDSVRKIKALDELWGTDLNLTSELMQN